MIDTIKIFITSEHLPADYLNHFKLISKNFKGCDDEHRGYSVQGTIENLFVQYNAGGLVLAGSLSRYYLGSNQYTLSIADIRNAIQKLSDELQISSKHFKVTRIDIANNIMTTEVVSEYIDLLERFGKLNRLRQPNGVYFKGSNRELSFYDKTKEAKKKGKQITPVLNKRNGLRYELKLLNHKEIAKILNIAVVYAEDVINNFDLFVDLWVALFLKIDKKHSLVAIDEKAFINSKEFDKQIQILGVESLGGLPAVLKIIKTAKIKGCFKKYPSQYSNFTSRYKKLMVTPKLVQPSTLVSELEQKVKMVKLVASGRRIQT